MRHPEDEQLLRYADGELPARAAAAIRSHLEACWQFREQLEQLQNTVGECVRYRKNILQRHLPPPPAPWADIYRGFGEIDAALAQASRFSSRGHSVLETISSPMSMPLVNSTTLPAFWNGRLPQRDTQKSRPAFPHLTRNWSAIRG